MGGFSEQAADYQSIIREPIRNPGFIMQSQLEAPMAEFDRSAENIGNLVSLDHLNLTIPDQQLGTLFYVVGLGMTRDPYLTVGLENMWINVGYQQFHVPTAAKAQVLRGEIHIITPNLNHMIDRLGSVGSRLKDSLFGFKQIDQQVFVTGPWGNRFSISEPGVTALGGTRLGISSINFDVPKGTANGIARFYSEMLGARSVEEEGTAVVDAGPGQVMRFVETTVPLNDYDGHHIAVYLADFSSAHDRLLKENLVTEESNEHQYRFRHIINPDSGEILYELEHEVRSMRHPMFGRPLINRDASISTRSYERGSDALRFG